MDNKLQNIKSIYERRNTSNNIKAVKSNLVRTEEQENVEENAGYVMKPRKSHVLDKVKFYEEKLKELEKLKNNILLLGLAKKFGLSKYVDFSQPKDPRNTKNIPTNVQKTTEGDSLNLYQDFTTFLIEIQNIIENYEVNVNYEKVKNEETLKENRELKLIIEENAKKKPISSNIINEEHEKETYSFKQEIERLKQELSEKENIIKILQEQNTEYEHLIRFLNKDTIKEPDNFRKDFTFGKFDTVKDTNFNQNINPNIFKSFSCSIIEKDNFNENKDQINIPFNEKRSPKNDMNFSIINPTSQESDNKFTSNLDSPNGNTELVDKESLNYENSAKSNDIETHYQAKEESNLDINKYNDMIKSVKVFDENEEKEKSLITIENTEQNKDSKLTKDFKLNITRESGDSSFLEVNRNESYQENEKDKLKEIDMISSQKTITNLDMNDGLKNDENLMENNKASMINESYNEGKNENEIVYTNTISENLGFNLQTETTKQDNIKEDENEIKFKVAKELNNEVNVNSNMSQLNKQFKNLDFSKDFNFELIADYLFTNYLLENSLSLKKINNIILDHFNLLLGTIFHRVDENNNFSYSFIHEYLEDIFIRIYDIFLSNTFKNLQHSVNKDIWNISSNTITEDLIKQIALSLFEKNTLSITLNLDKRTLQSFTQIKLQFISKYKKYFHEKQELFEKTILESEIFNSQLVSMVQSYKEQTLLQIKEIINKCKSNINAGKIITRSIIYDYKKFYVEYFDLDRQNDEVFTFTDNLGGNKSIDSLINSLKYKQNGNLKNLFISSNVQGKIDFPLGKLINTILLYARDLKHFSLTEAKCLNSIQQNILLRLLDFSILTSLDLSHNMIGDSGIRLITDCLKLNNFSLKTLDISFNGLTSNSGYYLGELLYLNNTLENLYLGGNNIIELGLHSLLNILSNNNKTLKVLDLSSNRLLQTDLSFISNLLSKNAALTTLNISMNSFEIDSLSLLSEALKYNKCLKVLIMNQVNINEDSSPYFLQHLNETNLSELYLENNLLKEIGGILFSNIIKHNRSLTKLSLKKCELNEMAISCISKALESNNTLKYLNLEENRMNEEIVKTLSLSVTGKNIKIYISISTVKNTNLSEEIRKSDNFIFIN